MRRKIPSNFQIEPEELLLDQHESRSSFLNSDSKIESHLNQNKFWLLFLVSSALLTIFLARAFWMDSIKGDYYAKRAESNNVKFYPQEALRGIIYDRNGKPLVENVPTFNLLVIPKFLPKDPAELNTVIEKASEIFQSPLGDLKKQLAGIDKNALDPVILETDIGEDKVLSFEARSDEFPGLIVDRGAIRRYENGSEFFHVLGYLGRVSTTDIQQDSYYSLTDSMGVAGLESHYEKYLRGEKGERAALLNSKGAVLNQLTAKEPVSGDDMTLSVDMGLQDILYNSLQSAKAGWNGTGAGAVVLDPRTGEVMALVSLPSSDSNVFSKGLSGAGYKQISSNPEQPLFNRVISGLYPAGSTIKPLIASAALQEKIIDPATQIDDTLGYISVPNQYDPSVNYIFRDWRPQGFVDMRKAIAVSADVYFYEIGGGYKNIKGLGIKKIDQYLNLFGFGNTLGIDLGGEKSGLVPTPEWKKKTRNQGWFTGDTYHVSIGQGDIMVTPLQMASAIAAIANGGTLFQPRLVQSIRNPDGQTIQESKPSIIRSNFIDPANLQIVKEGMRQAVSAGSARLLNDLPVEVAGKTGTAQFGVNNAKSNAWFVGFAPYDNPELAVAIVIDGAGEGSSAAVPVAKDIFQWYFSQSDNVVK